MYNSYTKVFYPSTHKNEIKSYKCQPHEERLHCLSVSLEKYVFVFCVCNYFNVIYNNFPLRLEFQ